MNKVLYCALYLQVLVINFPDPNYKRQNLQTIKINISTKISARKEVTTLSKRRYHYFGKKYVRYIITSSRVYI